MMDSRSRVAWSALLVALSLLPVPARSQSLWLARDRDTAIMLELLRPDFEIDDQDMVSGVAFLSGRAPIASAVSVAVEVPFARLGIGDESSSTPGNVYVGVESRPGPSTPFFGELGVRGPLVSEDEDEAQLTGLVTDVTRWPAFFEEAVTVQGALNLREVSEHGIAYRLRLSPALAISTGDADTELFAIYAWQIGYEGPDIRVGGALAGQVLVTDDSGNIGERSFNQFELHADFGAGAVRPGLELKVPLQSDISELVPVVLGVSLTVVP